MFELIEINPSVFNVCYICLEDTREKSTCACGVSTVESKPT